MLVLHRNETESLVITTPRGEQIIVKIDSFQRGGVRVAVDAPAIYRVHRSELLEEVQLNA
jgi:carbon storage regulator CsrA